MKAMEFDLSPKLPQNFYASDGGSYSVWDVPTFYEVKVGAGRLILAPRGLALPHYADAAKIGYVLQGEAIAGFVLPGPKEKVVRLKKGDVVPLRLIVASWWYNNGDSEFIAVFLGETSKAYMPGHFTYSFLTGTNHIFLGFSTEFLSRAWNSDETTMNKLLKSQTGQVIVKVKEGINIPEPCEADAEGLVFNFKSSQSDIDVKRGGRSITLTSKNFPLLRETGLSAKYVELDSNAVCSPAYLKNAAVQMIYVVRGSSRVEIVRVDGRRVLEAKVVAGDLFVVPKFFLVSQIADEEGMEWFSVITDPQPIFSDLIGKTSLLNILSPELLEAAFNVTPDVVKHFKLKASKL